MKGEGKTMKSGDMQRVGMQKGKLWGRGMAAVILMAGTLALTGNAALAAGNVEISEANFPDAKFRSYVGEHFDTDRNGILSEAEIAAVRTIDCSGTYTENNRITSLKGLEYFTALTRLYCSYNQLSSLDVSANTALTGLWCVRNQLSSLDVSANTALTELVCNYNQLSSLDVSANTALTNLHCSDNQLSSLDVSTNTALTNLYCSNNHLSSLDVSVNTALMNFEFFNNHLSSLDVSANKMLTYLACYNNQLSSLDVSANTALTDLQCSNNELSSLDVSANTALISLGCADNQLSSLDVSANTALTYLGCSNNELSSLDVSANTALKDLYCINNQLSSLDVSANRALKEILLEENKTDYSWNGADAWEYYSSGICLLVDKTTIVLTKDVTAVKSFVTRMYENCLYREPDDSGLNGWVVQLANGNMNGAQIAQQFIFSQELLNQNLSNADFVETLYKAMMGRSSDINGKKGWVSQLENGNMSRSEVTKCFVESTEFSGICAEYGIVRGSYDASIAPIEKFVERLYKLCLERNADQAGLYGWVGNLKNGNMNGAQMANSFFFSDEFVNKNVSNEKYVELLYNTLMGRPADEAGKAGWVSQLQGGHMDRKAVMKAFIESTEFTGICANYGIVRGSL